VQFTVRQRLACHCQAIAAQDSIDAGWRYLRICRAKSGFLSGLSNKGFCDLVAACANNQPLIRTIFGGREGPFWPLDSVQIHVREGKSRR
jgi:hypothetical protein